VVHGILCVALYLPHCSGNAVSLYVIEILSALS